jgi:hypothetical protein
MPNCEYDVRYGASLGAQAITPRLPTLPLNTSSPSRFEPGSTASESAPRRTTQCLVLRRSIRLSDPLRHMSLPDGPPPAHRVRSISARRQSCVQVQPLRRADDGRTTRYAPILRGCRRCGMGATRRGSATPGPFEVSDLTLRPPSILATMLYPCVPQRHSRRARHHAVGGRAGACTVAAQIPLQHTAFRRRIVTGGGYTEHGNP